MKLKQKKRTSTPLNEKQACDINSKLVSIVVCAKSQELHLFENKSLVKRYIISTAKNGLGEEKDSFKTPRGLHMIRAKIGTDAPINAIFRSRRFTGKIYTPELNELYPTSDWILTRILWLSGLELGKNRLGNVDTMQRYVYIHGSPNERPTGTPTSRGCIRMRNEDIIELFSIVDYGTKVLIKE